MRGLMLKIINAHIADLQWDPEAVK